MKKSVNITTALIAHSLALISLPIGLNASWTLLDDFESGDLSGWSQSQSSGNMDGSATIVTDPLPTSGQESNQVMEIFPGTQAESGTNNFRVQTMIPPIAWGESGTIYLRVGIPNPIIGEQEIAAQVSQVFGLSPVDEPTQWSDYSTATTFGFSGEFAVFDGELSAYHNVRDEFQRNVWYELWIYAENTGVGQQRYQVYVRGPGFDLDEPVLAYPATEDTFATMRYKEDGVANPEAAALDVWVFTSTTGSLSAPRAIDPVYIDDMYIDNSGKNLNDPRNASSAMGPGYFAEYELSADGWVDSSDFMGRVWVERYPWVYVESTGSWGFFADPDESGNGHSNSGAWLYFVR